MKERFLARLHDPSTLSSEDRSWLRECTTRYPWFALPKLMLAKIDQQRIPSIELLLTLHPAAAQFLASHHERPPHPAQEAGKPQPPTPSEVAEAEAAAQCVEVEAVAAQSSAIEEMGDIEETTVEMIDRFLATPPRKTPTLSPTADSQEDLSHESALLNEELVTEELAEIYLRQGHHSEAKALYTQLSLLNPEKSVYFAKILEQIPND